MKPHLLIVPMLFAVACDVDTVEKGEVRAPEVEVTDGEVEMPKVKVEGGEFRTPKVDVVDDGKVKLPRYEVETAEVEVEKKWIQVPTVDVEMPDEDETDGTAEADDEAN
jgi:hypothetical protein